MRLPRFEIDLPAVLGTTGIVLLVMAGAQLVPVAFALLGHGPLLPLLLGAAGTAAVGALLASLRGQAHKMTRRESLGIVVLSWLAATAAGAVPYLVTGAAGPLDAGFESLSGLTTTGASIFSDVDGLRTSLDLPAPERPPLALHVWRCLTHWIGGAGIVLIAFVLTPFLQDSEGMRRTQKAEAGFLTERYRGSTRSTLKGLLALYVGLTLAQTLAMVVLGVGPLDALLHAFGTVATGGFSTYTASLGTWGPAVQLVTVLFMLLGALNFAVMGRAVDELHRRFRTLRQERGIAPAALHVATRALPLLARSVWGNVETRAYLGIVLAACLAVAGILLAWSTPRYEGVEGVGRAAVDGTFSLTSVATTTGFGTEDFARWPWAAQMLMYSLVLMGGCSGSTAGGIKVRRVLILFLSTWREVKRFLHPRGVFPLRLGEDVVSDQQVREALAYATTYLGLLVLIGVGVTASGADPLTSFSSTTSCFASTGPGLGENGPWSNYQVFSPAGKLLLMAAMFLGRLEIYPVLAALMPSFWLRRSAPPVR